MKTPLPQLVTEFYQHYENLLNKAQSVVLLAIRLIWGFLFAQAGWGKWQDIPKVTGFFTDLGIPFPMLNAYVVSTTELVGGIFLMLGLLSRLTPIPLIIAMIVAYATTEQEALQKLTTGDLDPFFLRRSLSFPFCFSLNTRIRTWVLFLGPPFSETFEISPT